AVFDGRAGARSQEWTLAARRVDLDRELADHARLFGGHRKAVRSAIASGRQPLGILELEVERLPRWDAVQITAQPAAARELQRRAEPFSGMSSPQLGVARVSADGAPHAAHDRAVWQRELK